MTTTAQITLYDSRGDEGGAGTARLTASGRITVGRWLIAGDMLALSDRALSRLLGRIMRGWVADGATREYEGWDTLSEVAYHIEPCQSSAGRNTHEEATP